VADFLVVGFVFFTIGLGFGLTTTLGFSINHNSIAFWRFTGINISSHLCNCSVVFCI
jgi:hypothetical protein